MISASIPPTSRTPHLAPDHHHLEIQHTLRLAWLAWLALGGFPFFLFILAFFRANTADPATIRGDLADITFFATLVYLLATLPPAAFVRGYLFAPANRGQAVPPRTYLLGMITGWTVLSAGGTLAALGALAAHAVLPALLPAVVVWLLFALSYPTGRAMLPDDESPAGPFPPDAA